MYFNKNLQTETVFIFNNKEIKKHLKLLEHLTNSFNADSFQQISLSSEEEVFTVDVPPTLYSNLKDRPMVNPQIQRAVYGAEHGDEKAKPEQVDGHYIICDHEKDKYILLRSQNNTRFFSKVNKLGDQVRIEELINFKSPQQFIYKDMLK